MIKTLYPDDPEISETLNTFFLNAVNTLGIEENP